MTDLEAIPYLQTALPRSVDEDVAKVAKPCASQLAVSESPTRNSCEEP